MSKFSSVDTLHETMITSVVEISPGAFVLTFPREVSFKAGQVIKISMGKTDTPRMYSICSGEQDPGISFLFNVKQDGSLTPQLSKCKKGDVIYFSVPFGSFTGDDQPAWWIATGTGIAPFHSMLRSGMVTGKKLIHGVRYLNQFYFEKELKETLGESYIQCCSREEDGSVYKGRVTDYLAQVRNLPMTNKYYLCGNGLMVVEVRDLLIGRGIPFTQIISEIYF